MIFGHNRQVTDREPGFKYSIEHAITMSCDWAGILSPAQLDEVSKDPATPACNVYLIARRPRLTLDPSTFACTDTEMSFDIRADLGGGDNNVAHIEGDNPLGVRVRLDSPPPHGVVHFYDDNDTYVAGMPTAMWLSAYLLAAFPGARRLNSALEIDEALLDLDVVYVGQSQDAGGAVERRLLNHGTLQRIQAHTAQNDPHLEVWVILMRFENYNNLSSFGAWAGTQDDDASLAHHAAIHDAKLSRAEVTAIAEAALIRYFQPAYNEKFKDTFPAPLHKTYKRVYDLDYNAVGLDFESATTIGTRLGSDPVEPTFVHAALFAMHDALDRRRFFDLHDDAPEAAGALYPRRGV